MEKLDILLWKTSKASFINSNAYYYQNHDNTFHNFGNKKLTFSEICDLYIDLSAKFFHGKKLLLGEYTVYCYTATTKREFYSDHITKTVFILDYHGYRRIMLECEKSISYKDNDSSYGIEGYEEFITLLKECDITEAEEFDTEILFGDYIFDRNSEFHMMPKSYPYNHNKKSKFSEENGEIDLDHFIQMETVKGVYKPSVAVIDKIRDFDYAEKCKSTKTLKELGVHTVQFRNNANFPIYDYYDISDVKIKASKSVFEFYGKKLYIHAPDNIVNDIEKKKDEEEAKRLAEIAEDTFSLYQDGKPVLENVRSSDVVSFFENKELRLFEYELKEAAKKVFECSPEMNVIYFFSYGIYSYTELSGEMFVTDDIESVNKLMGISLPKRLRTMFYNDHIPYPIISEGDKKVRWDKGAVYVGVHKTEDGLEVIYEEGDQGI